MDYVDKIINDATSEDQLISLLKKHASEIHGKEAVNSIADHAETQDEANTMLKALAKTPKATKESQPLIDIPGLRTISTPDFIYGSADKLKYLAKPLTLLQTPITEAVRAPFKYIAENVGDNTSQTPSIDTTAEFKDIAPSDRAGLGLLLRDIQNSMGIQPQPLAKITSKDYPKAAAFAQQLTDPTNLAGAALDIATGSKASQLAGSLTGSLANKTLSPIKNILSNLGEESSSVFPKIPYKISHSTAMDYIRGISKNSSLLQKLEESGKIGEMATMIQENPELMNPYSAKKIYEKLAGEFQSKEGKRNYASGMINKLNKSRDELVSQIPSYVIDMPKEKIVQEMINRINEQGGEVGQKESAINFIKKNIPLIEEDPTKLTKIQNVLSSGEKIPLLEKQIGGENLQLQSQLSKLKQAAVGEAELVPEQIKNPNYREDLQWLAKQNVAESTGENIFPKQYNEAAPRTNEYYKAMADYLDENIRKAGRPLYDNEKLQILQDFHNKYNPPSEHPGASLENVALNPKDVPWSSDKNLLKVKTEKILPIIEGKQNAPEMIANPEKQLAMGRMIERLSELNNDLKNIAEKKVKNVSNKKLMSLIDEKQKLQGFIQENFDIQNQTPEQYQYNLSQQNQATTGEMSNIRKLGNQLMEPPVRGEMSSDIKSKNLAGRAMEKVARGYQNKAMEMTGDTVNKQNYSQMGKKVSNLINLQDLVSGNLVNENAGLKYLPMGVGGRSGLVSEVGKLWGRSIKPLAGIATNKIANIPAALTSPAVTRIGAASTAVRQFAPENSTVQMFKIPRNSSEILSNINLVKSKIYSVMGKDGVDLFDGAKTPEEQTTILYKMSVMHPGIFSQSKYNTFDGKILDPEMKKKALNDIVMDKGSPIQNAKRAEKLLHEGAIDE